jgi:hypothetical protein
VQAAMQINLNCGALNVGGGWQQFVYNSGDNLTNSYK